MLLSSETIATIIAICRQNYKKDLADMLELVSLFYHLISLYIDGKTVRVGLSYHLVLSPKSPLPHVSILRYIPRRIIITLRMICPDIFVFYTEVLLFYFRHSYSNYS